AVGVARPNRRHRPPEVVEVPSIGARDVPIGHRSVQESEEPSMLPAVERALAGNDAGHPVPALERTLVPEARDFRLGAGARRALLASEPLRLVVVPRVDLTREGGRRA